MRRSSLIPCLFAVTWTALALSWTVAAAAESPAADGHPIRINAWTSLAASEHAQKVLVGLVALSVLVGLWSSLGHRRPSALLRGPSVRNLFLGMRVGLPAASDGGLADFGGHLVSLDARGATFVSPKFLAKGDVISLSLDTVADFPRDGGPLAAAVAGTRILRGRPDTYLVTARFTDLTPTGKTPLLRFIHQLARQGQLSQ